MTSCRIPSMPALRCSMCSIDYPHSHRFMRCKVCGEQTSFFSDMDADPDWEDDVRLKGGDIPKPAHHPLKGNTIPELTSDVGYADVSEEHDPRLNTKEYWWRAEELYRVGFDYDAALYLATREDVDLHEAVKLARSAGPGLAFEILR